MQGPCLVGVGLALVLGVFINYFSAPKGNPLWLFVGVLLVVVAIVCNGMAAGKKQNSGTIGSRKGIVLATIAGVLMSFFYRFVASAMDLNNFISPTPGMATPYTAFFIFDVGIFFSNLPPIAANFYIFTILLICLSFLLIQDSQPLQSVPNAVFIHVRGDIICCFQHLFTGITHSNAGVGIL